MKHNPKWLGRILHITIFLGMVAWFIYTRMINNAGVPLDSEPINEIYESARIGGSGIRSASYWERWYLQTLSSFFLFLGNKILVILYFQIVLQCISFLLFIYIGWTIYRGIWGWTMSALYVFVPYTTDLVLNVTYINFWICIALIIISLLCIPIRIWKHKKRKAIAKQKITENANEINDPDASDSESVTTETLETESFEMDENLEDTGVIRVSDILKATTSEQNTENISNAADTIVEEIIINKTDMIENVLPMPKKHVSRTFEYSFEPSADMMHYDVELENDDYDYE